MALLTDNEIDARLKTLDGWTRQGNAIRKQFTFRDFPEAVLFVSALVPGAESADHHPDIEIHYKRVVLNYSTHSAGGITDKDFEGAKLADEVASQVPHMSEFSGGSDRDVRGAGCAVRGAGAGCAVPGTRVLGAAHRP